MAVICCGSVFLAVLSMLTVPSITHCSPADWLIANITTEVTVVHDGSYVTMTNGLITRRFVTKPAFGTVDFRSEVKDQSILRMITVETNITLDDVLYPVGGLYAAMGTLAFLNRSALNLAVTPNAFVFDSYDTVAPTAPFHWEPGLRHSPQSANWPPKGLRLRVKFHPPSSAKPEHANVVVYLNYEMYVGIPLLAKWVTVEYDGDSPIMVNRVIVEYLSTQKPYALFSYSPLPHPWEHGPGATGSWLYIQTNAPHGTRCSWEYEPTGVKGKPADYGADEPSLNCTYENGPGVIMANQSLDKFTLTQFDSFRVFELVTDSADRERVGLSRHRLLRLLAPQTQENPIFFHGTDSTPIGFKIAVEQMAAVGFEMFIYSFGSGFHMEHTDPDYIQQIADQIQFARDLGIEVGGYELIDLARGHGGYGGNVGDQWDCVDHETGDLTSNACFASGWYDKVHSIMFGLINQTGLSMVETDGVYGGQSCASNTHTYHTGYTDSIYWQNRLQGQFYAELKQHNVFINQPDNYFFQGGSKTGMGYNEFQYSTPRWIDLTIARQTIFDDTYYHLPTQGWMFLPLIQYERGGPDALFDPMLPHLLQYEWGLAQYLGYGVAACYRGPRLYDSIQAMQVAKKWVSFYKTYRDILIGDIVHVRRPDMQDYDCALHVNPYITNRGLAMIFNPTATSITKNITLPLYYTGISNKALLMHEGSGGTVYDLARDYTVNVPIRMDPMTITWYLIHSAD